MATTTTDATEVERLRTDNAWLDRHYRQATEADEAVHEKVSGALGLDEGISWDALVDKVRQMREENARVRDLHSPFKIYEPCGHDHEETDDGVTNVIEMGPVCQDGYMYTVCRHCCTDAQGFQTEECVSAHDHSTGICETRRALENTEVAR
jgi:hypothetical protein